ncbi:unnamed protein product, partial [Pylaiella littoralis]
MSDYPVKVSEYHNSGYIRDGEKGHEDEVALMHMRLSPAVTLKLGEGKRVCVDCICTKEGDGTCSDLCNCAGKCGNGSAPGGSNPLSSANVGQGAAGAGVG